MSEFDGYIVHGESGQREKADAWQAGIGLQDVDGLKAPSELRDTARLYIEGDISIQRRIFDGVFKFTGQLRNVILGEKDELREGVGCCDGRFLD